jgi:hypothetical protein
VNIPSVNAFSVLVADHQDIVVDVRVGLLKIRTLVEPEQLLDVETQRFSQVSTDTFYRARQRLARPVSAKTLQTSVGSGYSVFVRLATGPRTA